MISRLLRLSEKKALLRAFFLYVPISISLLISISFLWTVQSPLNRSTNNEIIIYLSLLLFLFLLPWRNINFKDPLVILGFFSLLLSYGRFLLSNDYLSQFFIYFLYAGNFLIFYIVGNSNAGIYKKKLIIEAVAGGFFIAGALTTLLIFYQWLGYANHEDSMNIWVYPAIDSRLSGNIAQANHAATLLIMSICAAFYFLYERKYYIALILYITLSVLATSLTGSRTGYISLFFVGVYLFYFSSGGYERIWAFFPLLLLIIFNSTYSLWENFSPLSFTGLNSRGLESGRYLLWKMAIDAIKESWIFGYGAENIIFAYKQQMPNHLFFFERSFVASSHNILMDMALRFGAIFLLLSLAVGLFLLKDVLLKKNDKYAIYCYLLCTPVFVHSLLEYPLNYAYFLLPVAILLGSARCRPNKEIVKSRNLKRGFIIVFGIMALFSFSMIESYKNIEENYKKLQLQLLGVDITDFYTGSKGCLIQHYCDFLDIHLIEDGKFVSLDHKYDQTILKISDLLPTPKTMYAGIMLSLRDGDFTRARREIINYCLVFNEKYCNYLRNSVEENAYDFSFPENEIKKIMSFRKERGE